MPLGDSITYGYNIPGAYRIRLWDLLADRDRDPLNFVGSEDSGPSSLPDQDNEGHNGWTIRQIRANVDGWMKQYKPDAVLLNIGDNDILYDDNPGGAPGRLQDLSLEICKDRPGVRLLLSNLIGSVGEDAADAAFNSKVPSVVAAVKATGCQVTFVDMHKAVPHTDLSSDGDHPTMTGYNLMADAWYAALAPMMARH